MQQSVKPFRLSLNITYRYVCTGVAECNTAQPKHSTAHSGRTIRSTRLPAGLGRRWLQIPSRPAAAIGCLRCLGNSEQNMLRRNVALLTSTRADAAGGSRLRLRLVRIIVGPGASGRSQGGGSVVAPAREQTGVVVMVSWLLCCVQRYK